MTSPGLSDADRIARSRFLVLTLVRLAGVVLMFVGLLIATTDLVVTGGLPALGLPIAALGLVESLLLPRMFARRWRTPGEARMPRRGPRQGPRGR